MDVSTIDNLDTLKSLAYDQIVQIKQAEVNLSILQDRISRVVAENTVATVADDKKETK